MNNEKVRAAVVELFEESGALGHYRHEFSAAIVDNFLGEKSVRLAEAIVRHVGVKFEEHAVSVAQQTDRDEAGVGTELADQKVGEPAQPNSAVLSVQTAPEADTGAALLSVVTAETPVLQEAAPASTELADSIMADMPSATPATPATSTPVPTPGPVPAPSGGSVTPNLSTVGGPPQSQMSAPAGRGDPVPRKFSFRLKGGKLQSGVPYEGKIESVDGSPGAVAHVLGVQLPPDIGLQADTFDPSLIVGIPTMSGDFSIGLTYRIEAPGADERTLASSISVFINHDPKSLWKDLPSDKDDPYWRPDVNSTFQQADARKMIAASKRGRSHAHEGKFRDDDFRIVRSEESGWTVIAVADGAGGASRSRRGAQLAVGRAVDVLLEHLAGDDGLRLESSVAAWHGGKASKESVISAGLYQVLSVAAFEACKAIEAEASAAGVAAKEYSTTLLVTAYKQLEIGHLFATYWVGDGGVGIYRSEGAPILLGAVDSGEFAGQTRFLDHKVMTTEEIAARLNFALVDDFKALVAMTDGITDPWFMTDNNLESVEYWDKLWSEIEPSLNAEDPQVALLSWLDFWSPGNHDDRTIAVLW